ncbi:beta-phosphoglucomutase family hydrolase [Agaribacter marinus]|uniref:Carotenoid dehydrogenase n=1 Tax=Agaribacter marinus TaxID=1431249 RepID=A0AA37T1M7_9ALTE|nr:beta-phosphoglucomutase family hydrolase [Agaribacter marinus]GLR72210.1 carotenoid dehydrogenase [Agaribacter marinus]
MIDLSKYKGIVFDMDGTLIDSMGSHLQAWEQTCQQFGLPFDRNYMYSLGGVPTINIAKRLNEKHGTAHNPSEIAALKKANWQVLDHNPDTISATVDILKDKHGKMPMGVGTGSERAHALELLENTGLLPYLDTVVSASDVTHGKPDPETFLTVAKNIGVAPQDCVVFEDTDIGREAAARAGMDCIMVLNGVLAKAG